MISRTLKKTSEISRLSGHNVSVRLRHKLNKDNTEKDLKLAADVVNYLEHSAEYRGIKDKLPNSLLRKYKTPESMYLINKKTAKYIANTVCDHIDKESAVIEVNPGLGFLSEELLGCLSNQMYMYETSSHFSPLISGLLNEHPGRVTYKVADFFGMWKLAFKDKIDNGNRIQELLGSLATNDNSRTVKIIGSMPGLTFIKHLLNNITFHNTSNQLGRPDLFITMPGHHYECIELIDTSNCSEVFGHFVCSNISVGDCTIMVDLIEVIFPNFINDNQIQHSKHKSIPALFQMFFDYKMLTTVPKVHFLPWTYPPSSKKVSVLEDSLLYLVNITQKQELPCPSEYLPLLWYFFKPHMFSKSTRVIPMLEQWIPGCGVWLISGQDPPDTNKNIAPGKDDAELPHMTIFTEFGDLTLKQKITVFKRFVSWPEFEQCPFKVTMENNLPKFVLDLEGEDKDTIGTHIDDISDHSDTEAET